MAVRPLKITVLADARQARKELSGFGSRLKGMLGGAAALAGGAGIAAGLKKVVTEASDAQQSLGATEAIYGKFADKVVRSSEKAADAVGLSANQYRESANLLGALFKNQGVELSKLSGETDKHLKLSADLAAMYGGTVPEAVDALTAAYKGEFNQLERYGVTLKQDTINTAANALAKKKYGKELKDLAPAQESVAKQLATQKLLFKQTGDAQGTFAKEADTLAGQQQRLKAELDDVSAEIGTALLPVLTDLAKWARDEVVPALEDFAKWLGENQGEIKSAASAIGDTLLPPLKALADLVIGAAKAFGSLPGPVKEFAVQAGIAAVVLPKLTAAMTVAQATGANFIGTMKDSTKRTAALGGVLRNVAGVGGMVALTQGATDGKSSIGSWAKSVGGAAVTGAILGSTLGPVGTAIGTLGGAAVGAGLELWDMKRASDAAKESAVQAKPKFDDWATTLDQATGAFTRHTRAMVLDKLQTEGLITAASQLGINTRDLIGATLGRADAMRRVEKAADGNTDILRGLEHQKLTDFIHENRSALKSQQTQLRQNNQDLKTWNQALRGIPKEVKTRLRQLDYEPSMKQVRNLKKQYDLTPKQVKTIVKQLGVEATKKQVSGLQKDLKGLGNVDPSDKWVQLYLGDLAKGKGESRKGADAMSRELREGTGRARPNLDPFTQVFQGNISGLKGTASSGGRGIGSNLGAGINSGIGGWFSTIAATAAAAVRNAAAAARAEAKIKSPSRVMRKIGEQMGEGLNVGMRAKQKAARTAGQKLAQAVRDGVVGGSGGVDKALSSITKAIEKNVTGKKQEKREKALLKRYRDEYAAIRRNAKAQDRVNERLEKARDVLREKVDELKAYAAAVKESFVAFGDVTGLGRQEDGSVAISSLLDQLKSRVNAAKRFSDLIQTLQAQGLNRTSIQQMLDAGPEAALATAEAIASGGASAVAELNSLTQQLANTGGKLGDEMADRYFGAGVAAAQGIVRGLEKEARSLDRAVVKLANELVKSVRKALGIKSPSRVFKGVGDNVVKGLAIGLDETYVKRSAASLAASLEQGFGTPALEAYASHRADQASRGSVRVVLSAQQVSQLQRGREIQADLDAYRAAGGRSRAS